VGNDPNRRDLHSAGRWKIELELHSAKSRIEKRLKIEIFEFRKEQSTVFEKEIFERKMKMRNQEEYRVHVQGQAHGNNIIL
jgi:hypothetical protein